MIIKLSEDAEFHPSRLFVGLVAGAASLGFGYIAVNQLKQATFEELLALFGGFEGVEEDKSSSEGVSELPRIAKKNLGK